MLNEQNHHDMVDTSFLSTPTATALQDKCPDLTGKYIIQGEDGRVHVTIKQTQCTSIRIVWAISSNADSSRDTHRLALDGAFHRDAAWFGMRGFQLTSARFRAATVDLVAKPLAARDSNAVIWQQAFERLANGDLCTRFRDSTDGEWSASLAARYTAVKSEEEAARRSEVGCHKR